MKRMHTEPWERDHEIGREGRENGDGGREKEGEIKRERERGRERERERKREGVREGEREINNEERILQ